MYIRNLLFSLLIFLCLLLNGCWDQRLLSELFIAIGTSIEKQDDKLITRYAFVAEEQGKQKIEVIVTEAGTLKGNDTKVNQYMDGIFSPSDISYTIMSSEVVKKHDLLSLFSVDYMSSSNVLRLIPVVTNDSIKDIFHIIETKNDYKYTTELLEDAAYDTLTTSTNLQKLLPFLYDPSMDFTLPYISIDQNKIKVSGVALFHNKMYTGTTLLDDDATFFLLLSNQKGKRAQMEVNISQNDQPFFIVVEVKKSKSKINIEHIKGKNIKASIHLFLQVFILETSNVNQYSKYETSFEKMLENYFTTKANLIINTLQKANCDAFGIGRELKAYHLNTWKQLQLDWGKHYQSVIIEPHVKVEVINKSLMDFNER
ncbi:Ger(x)C family spore germination protein [Chengkuizengella marina]|uniref:Ger(x)C family spore germination protein n=1 Tax=Chengkuizengella marina TaxID=2507566 RepID=UPI00136AC0E7|nr:Ger(x)C family spore germination protein [Chengkuizengella marina]